MKTLAVLLTLSLGLLPVSAHAIPGGGKAQSTSAITSAPVKRTLGQKIKAGWRKMGKFGQTATVVVVSGAAAFGLHQAGMSPVEAGATVGGALTLGAGTMALIAQKAKRVWSGSLAALKIKQLDGSKGAHGDAAAMLVELKQAAALNAAKNGGSKKEMKQKDLEGTFLNLGIVRAELALNDSTDSKVRLSGATLPAWKTHLGDIDGTASAKVTRDSEGKLALALIDLKGEIHSEQAVLQRHQAAVQQFEDRVPALFGGQMGKEAQAAKQKVAQLHDNEIKGEADLHVQLNTKMRGRVSDRIAGESGEFKSRRIRHGKLKILREGALGTALSHAHEADSELSSAISDRQSESMYEAQALQHTADVEHYTETEYYTDHENKQQSREIPKTRIVDNSQQYRSMAAMYASSAQSHTQNANNAMRNLAGKLQELQSNETIVEEKLFTPHHGNMSSAQGGPGWMSSWYMPEGFNLFSNMMSQQSLSSAQGALNQKLGALQALHDEVNRRESGELSWIDKQIDTDLDRQMASAK
jgi:hypothetical protein